MLKPGSLNNFVASFTETPEIHLLIYHGSHLSTKICEHLNFDSFLCKLTNRRLTVISQMFEQAY